MSDIKDEKGDDEYRDSPKEFGQSSDYANRGSSSRTSGEGPGEPGDAEVSRGEQEWKTQPEAHLKAQDDKQDDASKPSAGDGEVKSRSADPGQSSYGGFKNEGPSDTASGSTSEKGGG